MSKLTAKTFSSSRTAATTSATSNMDQDTLNAVNQIIPMTSDAAAAAGGVATDFISDAVVPTSEADLHPPMAAPTSSKRKRKTAVDGEEKPPKRKREKKAAAAAAVVPTPVAVTTTAAAEEDDEEEEESETTTTTAASATTAAPKRAPRQLNDEMLLKNSGTKLYTHIVAVASEIKNNSSTMTMECREHLEKIIKAGNYICSPKAEPAVAKNIVTQLPKLWKANTVTLFQDTDLLTCLHGIMINLKNIRGVNINPKPRAPKATTTTTSSSSPAINAETSD